MRSFLLVTLPRILLGLIFLASAIDGFWWLSTGTRLINPPTSEQGTVFQQALMNSGFFWPLMKVVDLVGALSLLFNFAPAFGLALLSPIMTVIVAFHFAINPGGAPVAVILIVLGGLLVWAYRDRYAALFR
jgi:putative oxidoreductase